MFSSNNAISTYAMAVFPVPGWPPIKIALPAILPSLIIFKIIPAALLALTYKGKTVRTSCGKCALCYLPIQPFLMKLFLHLNCHPDPILLVCVISGGEWISTSDMTVSSYSFNSSKILNFLDFRVDTWCWHLNFECTFINYYYSILSSYWYH